MTTELIGVFLFVTGAMFASLVWAILTEHSAIISRRQEILIKRQSALIERQNKLIERLVEKQAKSVEDEPNNDDPDWWKKQ